MYGMKWYYCTVCRTAAVHYDCCGNSSCNAGGCEKCIPNSDYITELLRTGNHPDEKELIELNREYEEEFKKELDRKIKECETK